MRKTAILYGGSLALLAILLRMLEYRFFIRDLSIEIYVAAIAILFTAVGIWTGSKLITKKETVIIQSNGSFELNNGELKRCGISPREFEVLELMAGGLSNQEIAEKLFVSLNTIKTHTVNIYSKLDVKRRTQAIQKAKELGLIP